MTIKLKIISGGQTGVDRAALDVALELGLSCGGWCPKGRLAEDGPIDIKYPLKETPTSEYEIRTEWNVRDSDATLIITHGKPTAGTAYTIAMCRVQNKPHLIIDLCHCDPPLAEKQSPRHSESGRLPCPFGARNDSTVGQIQDWLSQNSIRTLNIAGPRESNSPGIYELTRQIIKSVYKTVSA